MHAFPCMCGIPQTFSMRSDHFVGVCVCTMLLSSLCISGTFPSPKKNLCICEPWSVTQLFLTPWSSSVFGLHECVLFIYFLLKKTLKTNHRTRSPFCCLLEFSRILSRLIQLWLLIRTWVVCCWAANAPRVLHSFSSRCSGWTVGCFPSRLLWVAHYFDIMSISMSLGHIHRWETHSVLTFSSLSHNDCAISLPHSFKNIYFYSFFMYVLLACVYSAHRVRRGCWTLGSGVSDVCEQLQVLGTKPGSL